MRERRGSMRGLKNTPLSSRWSYLRAKGNMKTVVCAGCAVACALCIAGYAASINSQAEAARAEALERYGGDQLEVCVAKKDIAAGEYVDASSVEKRLWLVDLLPEGAVQTESDIVGRQATSEILAGEVVCQQRFQASATQLDIPAGTVAVSIAVKDVQAVGGAALPGTRVDLYSVGNTKTVLLEPEVLVLQTSASAAGAADGTSVNWVTVAIAPERVQEIVSASQHAKLYLTLPAGASDQTEEAS